MISRACRVCLLSLFVVAELLLVGCPQRASAPSEAEERGGKLFNLHCAPCHEETHPELKKQPPRLEGLFETTKLPSGAPATDEQVRKTIVEGIGTMPAFDQRLSAEDVDDLVKYLHTLK